METMYFILGMLSIVAAAFIAVTVWGIVKIVKFSKEIKRQEEWLSETQREFYNRLELDRQALDRKFENMNRHADEYMKELRRDLNTRFDNVYQSIEHRYTSVWNNFEIERRMVNDQITDAVTASKSYTDSRIDKLVDTYFDMVGSKKQIIKS